MSAEHPELIFIAGPQAGQRVILSRPGATLGRGSAADVLLSEDYASREQARYERLQGGPCVIGLSKRGTWINGRRYKPGKRVFLDTGDRIGVGKETEILFVNAGDDPDAALEAACRPDRARKNAFGKIAAPSRPVAQPAAPAPKETAAEAEAPPEAPAPADRRAGKHRPSEMSADERAELERQAKRRKLMIGLGVYFGVIAVIGIVLAMFGGGSDKERPIARMLEKKEIADALSERLDRPVNPVAAEARLERAEALFHRSRLEKRQLYPALVAFKEALAHSGGEVLEFRYHTMYRQVLNEVIELVHTTYRNACLFEKDNNWARAESGFFDVLTIVTDQNNVIFKNAQKHLQRVKEMRRRKKPGKRQPWQ